MKCTVSGKFQRLFTNILAVTICFSLLLTPVIAKAYNPDLLNDELYWIDKGEAITYTNDDYFQGFTKYIAHKQDKCFYLYASFTDDRINPSSSENITLSFNIKNEINSYSIQVNKDGIADSSSQNAANAFNIYYNFDRANCDRQGGVIFVAIEFKNQADKALTNNISCEYFCGNSCTYDLINGVVLDLYVPTSTKATTTKKATTKNNNQSNNDTKSTKKNSATSSSSNTVKKSNTTEKSTKFSATGSYSAGTGKYAGNKLYEGIYDTSSSSNQQSTDNIVNEQSAMGNYTTDANNYSKPTFSANSKIMLAVFGVMLTCGVGCVLAGALSGKKSIKRTDEKDTAEKSE